ncbi:hypothetical protein [Cellulomonas chengniuliangii]|uniref:hypothetical protein n=1 Tax=Cellulomonas chengniuliangii TaxID=2968084 RepID=UPI001D0E5D12|nr:hypothetical protein [Cellulomonas chengniuliangii]MCC2318642.1 hypothetical protein [Cellulomonas chengniuliangii]
MDETQDPTRRIQDVAARLRHEHASDPTIQTVGWGLPRRGGALADDLSIIFYVTEKLPSARSIEAAGSAPIPAEIDGFPTDVQVVRLRPAAAGDRDEEEYDPLRGGVATSNSENHTVWFNGSGTLGVLARDNATGAAVALSNWHVWGDGGSEGDQIIQPGHPTGGDHIEGTGKVIACGPLITSLIEWEAPPPLAGGLYAGAAAAALAAAASDYRDPTRRGQDVTMPGPGALTLGESVDMAIEYPDLPLPGVPFATQVTWHYERETTDGVLEHDVTEKRVNTQFLLGKHVVTNKAAYQPGETVQLTAAIWDYQPRPCDGYHVVAHLIPHRRPRTALRVVLQPTACPRRFPDDPPDGEPPTTRCVDFDDHPIGQYPSQGAFEWLRYLSAGESPVRVVDWFSPARGLQLPTRPLVLHHAPATRVTAQVVLFHPEPVTLTASNAAGEVVARITSTAEQGEEQELELTGEGIVRVVARGGGGEALLLRYCADPVREKALTIAVGEHVAAGIRAEQPALDLASRRLQASRCCFGGSVRLPPDDEPGRWDVHLTVQNVNPVPQGTPPDQAATVIGGHLLSAHTSAEVIGCTAVMLLDHVFDVI